MIFRWKFVAESTNALAVAGAIRTGAAKSGAASFFIAVHTVLTFSASAPLDLLDERLLAGVQLRKLREAATWRQADAQECFD